MRSKSEKNIAPLKRKIKSAEDCITIDDALVLKKSNQSDLAWLKAMYMLGYLGWEDYTEMRDRAIDKSRGGVFFHDE